MGTNLGVLSENYPMDTNMTGFRWFKKSLRSCAMGKSPSIARVNPGKCFCGFLTYKLQLFLYLFKYFAYRHFFLW